MVTCESTFTEFTDAREVILSSLIFPLNVSSRFFLVFAFEPYIVVECLPLQIQDIFLSLQLFALYVFDMYHNSENKKFLISHC